MKRVVSIFQLFVRGSSGPTCLVAGLLLLLVFYNVLVFRWTESAAIVNWKALHRWSESQETEVRAVRNRYGMYVALRKAAANPEIIIPPNKPPSLARLASFQHQIYGLALVRGLRVEEFTPVQGNLVARLETLGVNSYACDAASIVTKSGRRGRDGTFHIITCGADAQQLVLLLGEGHEVAFVDPRVLSESDLRELGLW